MIFLIVYDRVAGCVVGEIREFFDDERLIASGFVLELEIQFAESGIDREVVILEARSKDALMKTHRRYFSTASDLAGRE